MMETLSEAYGWLPSEIRKENYYDIMAHWKVLHIKRKIAQIESKRKK